MVNQTENQRLVEMSNALNKYAEHFPMDHPKSETLQAEQMRKIREATTVINQAIKDGKDPVGIACALAATAPGNTVDLLNLVLYPDNSELNPDIQHSPELRLGMYVSATNFDMAVFNSMKQIGRPLSSVQNQKLQVLTELNDRLSSLSSPIPSGEQPGSPFI